MMLIEFDLAGAEWVVVAYMSGDQNMLDVIESGRSPHVVTGALISGASEDFVTVEYRLVGSNTDPDTIRNKRSSLTIPHGIFLPRSMSIRQAGKKSNHGCNYYMRYRRFALENEMPETDAKPIVEYYSERAYPGLKSYWEGTQATLRRDGRCLTNCLGRKVRIMGEWGVELWMAAYAFTPQSTVFDVCRTGMIRAYNDETLDFYDMHLGAQVHDSLMSNYPMPTTQDEWYALARFMNTMVHQHMKVPLRYTGAVDMVERDFVLNAEAKLGLNWGEMHSIKVTQDLDDVIEQIKRAITPSQEPVASVEPEWQAMALVTPEL